MGLGAGQSVTFTLDSASGTATEGTDFSALTVAGLTPAAGIVLSNITTDPNGTIHVTATNTGADLASGAALLSFAIATTQDTVVEGTETFTVTLGSATATVVTPTITTSITDNDTSAITLSGPASVAEGAATGPYTVSLANGVGLGAGQSVTFTLDSASGTATEGTDFSALLAAGLTPAAGIVLSNFTTDPNGTIHVTATNTGADLASGAALLSFAIATTQDTVVEGTETFTVTLGSATATVVTPTIPTSITDNDTSAITLSGPASVAEGAATSNYTVSLSGVGLGAGQSVTFTLDSASGTATEGTDFSALTVAGLTPAAGIVLSNFTTDPNGTIHVTATNTGADLASGAALLSFAIATTQDTVVEGTETFTVTLGSATATVVTPTIPTSITDNDTSAITLSGPASVAEGAATGPYTVSLANGVGLGAGQSVTFTLDSASGTATEGTDFSALLAGGLTPAAGIVLSNFTTDPNGTIHVTATNTGADLASGAALLSFAIATTQDTVVEGTETFTVTLGSATATVITPTIPTSITDNDTSAITLSGPASVAEGATTGPYTVSLANGVGLGAGQSVTFTLDSASGTATEGADFSALTVAGLTPAAGIVLSNFTTDPNGTIHVTATNTGADLASGAALLSFAIATTQDTVVEATETFTVTLGSATATVVTPTIPTSITDNDTSAITLSGPASVAEGAATGPYTVSLANGVGLGAGQSVTFTLDSASGTATEGTDFSALTVAGLTPAAGIVLSNFTTDPNGTIHVTATNTGADLASGAALLSFAIATTQDTVVEGTETFTVTLGSATATVVTPTIPTSITDDDTSGITLSGPASVAEGATTSNYTVSLSGVGLGAGQSVTFTLDSASGTATEGTDFSALLAGGLTPAAGIVLSNFTTDPNGTIHVTATNTGADLASGAALLSFAIATTQDTVVEGTETFTVTLGSATATVVTPTIPTSITDNDTSAITLSGPASVAEGAATGPYTVSLANGVGLGAGQSVTFTLDSASGTATEGADFSALTVAGLTPAAGIVLSNFTTDPNGTIHVTATNTGADLASGAALLSFAIATTQDTVVEATETFTVTLGSATATVITPTIPTSITDNDTATWSISGDPSVTEGNAASYTVHLAGTLQAGQTATINLALTDISTTSADHADFVTAVNTAITGRADLSFNAGTGTLTYTGTGSPMQNLVISLPAINDGLAEGPEQYAVSLSNPGSTTGANVVGTGSVATTIINLDIAPVVDLNGPNNDGNNNTVSYPSGVSQLPIAPSATITDLDSANLVSMTVTITNPQDNSAGESGANIKEHLLLNATAAAILAAHPELTMSLTAVINDRHDAFTLSITGSASRTVYQDILEGVAYTDSKGGSHSTTDRIVTVVVNDGTLASATQTVTVHVAFPAGVAGEPINLALAQPSVDHVGPVTLTIAGIPTGWSLSEGADNGNGTWTVQTNDIAALAIISPVSYTGALMLNVAESWTNADGSTGSAIVSDNVEVFAKGAPIFAWSGDDTLTGAGAKDMFVFAQPIGNDIVYNFNAGVRQNRPNRLRASRPLVTSRPI